VSHQPPNQKLMTICGYESHSWTMKPEPQTYTYWADGFGALIVNMWTLRIFCDEQSCPLSNYWPFGKTTLVAWVSGVGTQRNVFVLAVGRCHSGGRIVWTDLQDVGNCAMPTLYCTLAYALRLKKIAENLTHCKWLTCENTQRYVNLATLLRAASAGLLCVRLQ